MRISWVRRARTAPGRIKGGWERRWGTAARRLSMGLFFLLAGCSAELLDPKGSVGVQEKNLILLSLGLMLLVVIPVIALTLYFAWRYRETNSKATYAPNWSHSTRIEVVVWGIPCVIVAFLAVLIWRTTHTLDPYRPLESDVPPVRVEVIAMNWKWLFIYPDYGVASVNKLAIPVGAPIEFRITADSLMNSFFIPQLGSQVYAMPGMQTKLHLIADTAGTYDGLSAAYSGAGFSDMHFDTVATSREDFDKWVAQARQSPLSMGAQTYKALEQASTRNPPALYAGIEPALFNTVVNQYMSAGAMPGMDMSNVCGPAWRAASLGLSTTGPAVARITE